MSWNRQRVGAPGVARQPLGDRRRQAPLSIDARRLARIRWRCRRGMLENDLVLARFLDENAATLTESDMGQFDKLLDLTDNALWELIAGREEPSDAALAPLVARLRNA